MVTSSKIVSRKCLYSTSEYIAQQYGEETDKSPRQHLNVPTLQTALIQRHILCVVLVGRARVHTSARDFSQLVFPSMAFWRSLCSTAMSSEMTPFSARFLADFWKEEIKRGAVRMWQKWGENNSTLGMFDKGRDKSRCAYIKKKAVKVGNACLLASLINCLFVSSHFCLLVSLLLYLFTSLLSCFLYGFFSHCLLLCFFTSFS